MHEILPGIHHWTAYLDTIGARVSSYFVAPAAMLVDPKLAEGGLDALAALPVAPRVIVLTNRQHNRDCVVIAEALDCPIRVPETGMHAWTDVARARPYRFGEQVAPGVRTVEIGHLAPDEAGLHIAVGAGALAVGDTVTRRDGQLAFVPDFLIGDDPEAVKAALRTRFAQLLDELAFEALLLAHGEPLATGGRAALRAFVESEAGA